jgi:hypothetical protein
MDAKNNLWNSGCMKVQSWELSLYIDSKHHNSINYVKLENAFEFCVTAATFLVEMQKSMKCSSS